MKPVPRTGSGRSGVTRWPRVPRSLVAVIAVCAALVLSLLPPAGSAASPGGEPEGVDAPGGPTPDTPLGTARRVLVFSVPTLTWADVRDHDTPNMDRLLDACDAVAICSVTSDHKALIGAAIAARRPILCEKPLAVSVAEGVEICRMFADAGLPFMQSFPKRFDPVTHAIRKVVESGDLGTITMCRIRHGHSHGLSDDFRKAWFVAPAKSGGGTEAGTSGGSASWR